MTSPSGTRRVLLKPGVIVTMDAGRRILRGGAVLVNGTAIEAVLTAEELHALPAFDGIVHEAGDHVLIPGFIQTHMHLCQTIFSGLADDLELLDWLSRRIFPFEDAHTQASLSASALLGNAELIRSGTTTIMDMGSVRHEEEIASAITVSGIRAFIGKAMMDINTLTPALREPTGDALRSTREQAREWHGAAGGRLMYAVAPRFVLSCTDELLREAHAMTAEFPGMLFHTHAAENKTELHAVRERCRMDNLEYFDSLGILRSNTCLAHCIWLNDREIGLLADHTAKVLHCPSSNLKLSSGIAPIPALMRRGVMVSLGADGAACNNRLDMFEEMRLAALIQKPVHGPSAMDAESVFAMATLGGAATLGIGNATGSIEQGKKADLVLLDLNRVWNPSGTASVYSALVYSGNAEHVRSVMIDGAWVYRDGRHITLDEDRIIATARQELQALLRRVH